MTDKDPILDPSEFEIDFQEFSNTVQPDATTTPYEPPPPYQPTAGSSSDYMVAVDSDTELDSTNLLRAEGAGAPTSSKAFWSLEFYQQFFNVNDDMVLERLMYACLPLPSNDYMGKLRPSPDFYGPLWVCITLVFSTAISGNIADFFATLGSDSEWTYDFKKVTIAATVIFTYVTLVPSALSGYLWWRKTNTQLKLVESLSLYGYSLTAFIPISILLCINHEWIRWLLVLVIVATSGAVLALTVWRLLAGEPRQLALVITAVLIALHLSLILLFKMYFFAPSTSPAPAPTPTQAPAPEPAR